MITDWTYCAEQDLDTGLETIEGSLGHQGDGPGGTLGGGPAPGDSTFQDGQ